MTRSAAINRASLYFDSGAFITDLSRRVAFQTESQGPDQAASLLAYLEHELGPAVKRLGFSARIVDNPEKGYGALLMPIVLRTRHCLQCCSMAMVML